MLATYLGTAEVRALDESTVRIVTAEPMADLLDLMAAILVGPERDLPRLPGTLVGSGPYRIASQADSRVVLAAHDRYWGPAPRYPEIRFVAEPDARKRVDALLAGEADVAAGIGIEGKRRLAAAGGAAAHERESGLCIIFMLNAQNGPCKDRRVRQALNYALDVDAIIAGVMNGGATRLNGYLTAHHFGYNPETPAYPHDPEKARRLLAEAGYGKGLTLVVDIPSTMPDEAPALTRMMAEQYKQVGITVKVVEHGDRAAYSEMVRDKKINDACCFDSSPRSTFRVLREKLHSGLRGPWWEGYRNPQVDALIEQAQATVSDADRQKTLPGDLHDRPGRRPVGVPVPADQLLGRASDDHGLDASPGRPGAAAIVGGAEQKAARRPPSRRCLLPSWSSVAVHASRVLFGWSGRPGLREPHDHLAHVRSVEEADERRHGLVDSVDHGLLALQRAGAEIAAHLLLELGLAIQPIRDDQALHRQPLGGDVEEIGGAPSRLLVVVHGDPAAGDDAAVEAQRGQCRFQGLTGDVVEVDVDAGRRRGRQLVPDGAFLVVEGAVESALLPQELHLRWRAGRTNHAAPIESGQLSGHMSDSAGGP